jgi:hypothetical protein
MVNPLDIMLALSCLRGFIASESLEALSRVEGGYGSLFLLYVNNVRVDFAHAYRA